MTTTTISPVLQTLAEPLQAELCGGSDHACRLRSVQRCRGGELGMASAMAARRLAVARTRLAAALERTGLSHGLPLFGD
ncbi:MAG: hypothetical protein ACK5E6_04335 [Cyanobacteriota bacterium]|jgi:hypothetical protein